MKSKIQKNGSNLIIQIPMSIALKSGISENSTVDVKIDDGKIVISNTSDLDFNLNDFLGQINDQNLHVEQRFGNTTGTEFW
ncbi:MAG TPA: hypothetical protein DCE78_04165 [Bacteroidetes bacterium]|nr:hypothetical protein [Bacteroidota bacterium]